MRTLYLFLGGIGSGKSTLAGFISMNEKFKDIEFVCADIYKKIYFEDGPDLKLNYKKAKDYMRYKIGKLVRKKKNLIIEMVPSKQNKLKLIKDIKDKNLYNIIAFYVGTADATINTIRVSKRTAQGADPVRESKTVNRHEVCLSNIIELLNLTDLMYFLDNSGSSIKMIACQEKSILHVYNHVDWFKQYVLEKIEKQTIIKHSVTD